MSAPSATPSFGPCGREAPRVILCGPFPNRFVIGGYARCNELTASSFLDERFGMQRLPVTVPGEGGFVQRLLVDLARTRRCLAACPAPVFHLTAQYLRGTYREWVIYRMAKRAGRAFVFDIRAGTFVRCFEERRAPFRRRLLDEMLRGADAITVEGRTYISWIARRFGREAVYFPNFVQARHRSVYPSAGLERPAAGAPVRLVYSGRLISDKGLAEAIAACGRLRVKGIRTELHLVGPGEPGYVALLRRVAHEAGVADCVFFPGRLEHDALLRLLAACHVFVFPSRWYGEGHSNAVNEAMQVGLPIVASRQGFLEDVVTPACGALLDTVAVDSVERALETILRDWDGLRACGHAARERVYREFSDEAVLPRLAGVYEALLRAKSGARTS